VIAALVRCKQPDGSFKEFLTSHKDHKSYIMWLGTHVDLMLMYNVAVFYDYEDVWFPITE
jgi:hypothetical protein